MKPIQHRGGREHADLAPILEPIDQLSKRIREYDEARGSADALVEEDEQQCGLVALRRETVGVTLAIALHQPVSFHLAEVVMELGKVY